MVTKKHSSSIWIGKRSFCMHFVNDNNRTEKAKTTPIRMNAVRAQMEMTKLYADFDAYIIKYWKYGDCWHFAVYALANALRFSPFFFTGSSVVRVHFAPHSSGPNIEWLDVKGCVNIFRCSRNIFVWKQKESAATVDVTHQQIHRIDFSHACII